ncbi:metallophosphoesterase [Variovorax sp. LjRoot175]|uniref:metallophosphoesterase n=1 Tax=Variovorax sp. LjRoot175 TaxID=3342276 RepID=UPI003ECF19CE
MKLLILSDLHLEFETFEPPQGLEFDVVVLAGDIHSPGRRAVEWAEARFAAKPVVYVPGNHEYYDSRMDQALAEPRSPCIYRDLYDTALEPAPKSKRRANERDSRMSLIWAPI